MQPERVDVVVIGAGAAGSALTWRLALGPAAHGVAREGGAQMRGDPTRGGAMARAMWNGRVLAESGTYEVVEGNVYVPREAVKREVLKDSSTHTTCFGPSPAGREMQKIPAGLLDRLMLVACRPP